MLKSFLPSPTLTTHEVQRSLRLMIWEGVASGAMFSLGSGGFMAAYALALGANNLQVGLLAALPFITQIAQLPTILAVERFRKRKLIQIPAMLATHALWLPIGAVPFLLGHSGSTCSRPCDRAVGTSRVVLVSLDNQLDELDARPRAPGSAR